MSSDPLEVKYPYMSPYSAFGNNPVYYIDPGGETLRVSSADPKIIEQFRTLVSVSFNGSVLAEVAENGTVTFHKVPDTKMTEYEAAAFAELKKVEESKYTAEFNLVNNDANVTTADFYGSVLDVGDVISFGNNDNTLSSKSVLVHEAVEQLTKAEWEYYEDKKITSENDADRYYYRSSHKNGLEAERKTTNLQRDIGGGTEYQKADGSLEITGKGVLKTPNGPKEVEHKTTYDTKWNNPKTTVKE